MSKEAILIKQGFYLPLNALAQENIIPAMDEYAKEVAMDFLLWCHDRDYKYLNTKGWVRTGVYDELVSHEQLYDLYKKDNQ